MKIAIGSTNPAKVKAVEEVFKHHQIECFNVPSGVSEQPFSDEETIQGAINRAKHALEISNADLSIGLEGGVTESPRGLLLCNWGALVCKSDPEKPLIAGGARLLLPDVISNRLRQGEELGPVMDDFCQKVNIRAKEGAIGIFTNGRLNRSDMFIHIVRMLQGQLEYYSGMRDIF